MGFPNAAIGLYGLPMQFAASIFIVKACPSCLFFLCSAWALNVIFHPPHVHKSPFYIKRDCLNARLQFASMFHSLQYVRLWREYNICTPSAAARKLGASV
jgi:hypothetical protein